MAKSQATFSKKEKEKKRLQKKKEKEERLAERRANAKEGKTLEDMLAYVDENGNLTTVPPDPSKKRDIKEEDIDLGSRNREGATPVTERKGRVMFFNDAKGYGFIKDENTGESIFVHSKVLSFELRDNDRVTFETEKSPKGLSAVNVRKV